MEVDGLLRSCHLTSSLTQLLLTAKRFCTTPQDTDQGHFCRQMQPTRPKTGGGGLVQRWMIGLSKHYTDLISRWARVYFGTCQVGQVEQAGRFGNLLALVAPLAFQPLVRVGDKKWWSGKVQGCQTWVGRASPGMKASCSICCSRDSILWTRRPGMSRVRSESQKISCMCTAHLAASPSSVPSGQANSRRCHLGWEEHRHATRGMVHPERM